MKFFNCVDNYLDNKICDKYIEIYDNNIDQTYQYSNTNPLKIEPNKHSEQIKIDLT